MTRQEIINSLTEIYDSCQEEWPIVSACLATLIGSLHMRTESDFLNTISDHTRKEIGRIKAHKASQN